MKKFFRLTSTIVLIGILSAVVYGLTHRQQLLDYLALRNYTPDARLVALANDMTMQDNTRRIFYVNHPELNDKQQFRNNCPATEQSIVLGCYVQHKGIFLLDVNDERLSGVVQVTAAHETLHAHYDRLSGKERAEVDKWTDSFFANLQDERVKKSVEQYRAKDPSVVPNELHSILATEVRNLSPELEAYYSRYFKNRVAIVEYSEKYEQTFVDLTNQVETYDQRLKVLKTSIEANQIEAQARNGEIELQRNRLDALINGGKTEEYNAAVPEFNSQVNSYNNLVNEFRGLVAEYNQLVEKRNAIATAEQELIEAINSNIMPSQPE